jgi:hypothetical protein
MCRSRTQCGQSPLQQPTLGIVVDEHERALIGGAGFGDAPGAT